VGGFRRKEVEGTTSTSAKPVAQDVSAADTEGKSAFSMELTYENGFMKSDDNQFKLLCPVQMVNGQRVKLVGFVQKDAKVG
jgi:hypothetical protein